jgi:hypothetical protein
MESASVIDAARQSLGPVGAYLPEPRMRHALAAAFCVPVAMRRGFTSGRGEPVQ